MWKDIWNIERMIYRNDFYCELTSDIDDELIVSVIKMN